MFKFKALSCTPANALFDVFEIKFNIQIYRDALVSIRSEF